MIADALSLIEFLQRRWQNFTVISALFKWDGTRLEGDERLQIERIPVGDTQDKWFYRVKEVEGYVFVYMPVIPTVYVDYGTLHGDQNPDARIFRFVGNIFSSVISGGNSNVRVDFIVIGYKPKDLLKIKEKFSHQL